ncbi:hypothetical protein CIW83_18145 [Tissierella sp. P1]|uniref:hypothetical protein n=1 Tax=Tissierella sp. P1 TaxID=1280483 RepID=UPI000BA0C9A1|nr:hypothetical protein [Tissierella sp. P1]OZV10846.1 hypothetical protein CIW83_18145 [Tissierella sp. P1]
MGKFYLNDNYTSEEVLEIVKKELKNPKVIRIEKNMNSFDIITNWGKFSVIVQQNTLEIKQGWNKEKFPIIIGMIVAGFIFWIPFIGLMVLVYLEYKNCKEFEGQIMSILNKGKNVSMNM